MRAAVTAFAAAAVLPLTLLAPTAAGAAPAAVPQVGECYDLSDELLQAGGWWGDVEPVPCSQEHTFEVTDMAVLPADVNAFDFAARQCGSLDVWAAIGLNVPAAGVVDDPLRIEARSFGVRQPPASYVCGAVAVTLNGTEPPTAVRVSAPFDRLSRRMQTALRHCSSAADGRRAQAPAITVPCTSRPRWQVESWVMWTAFYDDYPGRPALKRRASDLCGADAVATLPLGSAWEDGPPLTWCYQYYP
jgi:hypothetical protein